MAVLFLGQIVNFQLTEHHTGAMVNCISNEPIRLSLRRHERM